MAAVVPAHTPQALLAKHGKRLFGVESRRPLNEFDVLGFSLSYELGGTNILEMLRQAGVPVTWEASRAACTPGCSPWHAARRAAGLQGGMSATPRQAGGRPWKVLCCAAACWLASSSFTCQRGPAFSD